MKKKIMAALLVAAMVIASVMPVSAEESSSVWSLGASATEGTTTGATQGENGWHFMWTPETNVNGAFDESKIEDCVIGTSSMYIWGIGVFDHNWGYGGWMPGSHADYDASANTNFWYQMPDGTNNPHIEAGDTASAVIGWEAQESGVYSVDMSYTAGTYSNSWTWEGVAYAPEGEYLELADGVTVSVNANGEALYTEKTADYLTPDYYDAEAGWQPDVVDVDPIQVELEEGEMIYFIADSNASGWCDASKFDIAIEKVAEEPATPDYSLGQAATVGTTTGATQGENGWHFMWSPETNVAGTIDESKVEDCVIGTSSMYIWGIGVFDHNWGYGGWMPGSHADYDASANTNFWYQMPNGTNNPHIEAGDTASAIIGWEAQAAGTYEIAFSYTAGTYSNSWTWEGVAYAPEGEYLALADGVTVSVNANGETLYAEKTADYLTPDYYDAEAGWQPDVVVVDTIEVELEEGEMIYFVADPNASGWCDASQFDIQIFAVEAEEGDDSQGGNVEGGEEGDDSQGGNVEGGEEGDDSQGGNVEGGVEGDDSQGGNVEGGVEEDEEAGNVEGGVEDDEEAGNVEEDGEDAGNVEEDDEEAGNVEEDDEEAGNVEDEEESEDENEKAPQSGDVSLIVPVTAFVMSAGTVVATLRKKYRA